MRPATTAPGAHPAGAAHGPARHLDHPRDPGSDHGQDVVAGILRDPDRPLGDAGGADVVLHQRRKTGGALDEIAQGDATEAEVGGELGPSRGGVDDPRDDHGDGVHPGVAVDGGSRELGDDRLQLPDHRLGPARCRRGALDLPLRVPSAIDDRGLDHGAAEIDGDHRSGRRGHYLIDPAVRPLTTRPSITANRMITGIVAITAPANRCPQSIEYSPM